MFTLNPFEKDTNTLSPHHISQNSETQNREPWSQPVVLRTIVTECRNGQPKRVIEDQNTILACLGQPIKPQRIKLRPKTEDTCLFASVYAG